MKITVIGRGAGANTLSLREPRFGFLKAYDHNWPNPRLWRRLEPGLVDARMNASLERKLTQSLPRMPNTEEGLESSGGDISSGDG